MAAGVGESPPRDSILTWLAAPTCFAVAVAALTPALGAGFHPEDFGWLAIARRVDSPLWFFTDNLPLNYFYRPLGLSFWWLCTKLLGTDAFGHHLVDAAVHGLNAALLARFASRSSGRPALAWMAGLVFATLPATTATAAWMSDRFDLLALCFSLAALLAGEQVRSGRGSRLRVGALLLLALLAKEIAYVTAAVLLVRLLVERRRGARIDTRDWLCVALPAAVALGLRALTVPSLAATLDIDDLATSAWRGSLAWWQRAPAALIGFTDTGVLPSAIGLLAIAIALTGSIRAGLGSTPKAVNTRLVVTGLGFLLLPALVQWPITYLVLVDDRSTAFAENLRFYYFAGAGFALLVSTAYATGPSQVLRASTWLVVVLACAAGFWLSHRLAMDWRQRWRASSEAALRLGTALAARDFPPGCRIGLAAADAAPIFRQHADTIVKAVAATTASVQNCVIFAGTNPALSLLPATQCAAAQWPGLVVREYAGQPLLGRYGNLCLVQFSVESLDRLGTPRFTFELEADGTPHEIHEKAPPPQTALEPKP